MNYICMYIISLKAQVQYMYVYKNYMNMTVGTIVYMYGIVTLFQYKHCNYNTHAYTTH